MQFNRYITFPKHLIPSQQALFFGKAAIFILIAYLFYIQGWVNKEKLVGIYDISRLVKLSQINIVLLVIVLMPFNWLCEIFKWKVIAEGFHLTLQQATKGVIQGLTLGSILPFGAGEITGRVMSIKGKPGIRTIPSILVAQVLQTLVTISFGSFGVFLLVKHSAIEITGINNPWVLIFLLFGLILIAVFLFYKKDLVLTFLDHMSQVGKVKWIIVLFLGIVRYMVFLAQFVLLASSLYSNVTIKLLIACGTWVFLVRTIIPRLNQLTALGIRGVAASTFMSCFGFSDQGIIQVVFILWLINIFVPSIAGLFLIPNTIINAKRLH